MRNGDKAYWKQIHNRFKSKSKWIRENEWVILLAYGTHTGVRRTTESIMHTNDDYARVRMPLIWRRDFSVYRRRRRILARTHLLRALIDFRCGMAWRGFSCIQFDFFCWCFGYLPRFGPAGLGIFDWFDSNYVDQFTDKPDREMNRWFLTSKTKINDIVSSHFARYNDSEANYDCDAIVKIPATI